MEERKTKFTTIRIRSQDKRELDRIAKRDRRKLTETFAILMEEAKRREQEKQLAGAAAG